MGEVPPVGETLKQISGQQKADGRVVTDAAGHGKP